MDLNLKYRLGIGRLVKKRDKTFGEMAFNTRFLTLFEQDLEERNEKKRKAFELESKKRLLPLEIEATPGHLVNSEMREKALSEFIKKQSLPRRAVIQSAKRIAAKQGEAAGKAFSDKKLGELDKKLDEYKVNIFSKYPEVDISFANETAVAKYDAAATAEAAKMAEIEAEFEKQKQNDLKKAAERMKAKNAKLQVNLDAYNAQLQQQYAANTSKLDDGMIMGIKNMKMYFSGIKAVDDLSFDIKEGDIFGLIGPNGAGKTTLFNCITQFYKADAGEIYYRDRFGNVIDLRDYQSHNVANTGIIRTFQNLALVPFISVLDNLMVGAHIYYNSDLFHQFLHTRKMKYEEKANRDAALDILERLGLTEYKDLLPTSLSYGALKKVELARTLMTKPRLIILDEPAAGLNDAETEELSEIIRKIRDDYECTIFLVEHDMNLVMNVCDTVCAISFGKKLAIGTPEEIQTNPLVQEAYLGHGEEEGE